MEESFNTRISHNDLRIGNWVYIRTEPSYKARKDQIIEADISRCKMNPEYYSPITLNPENLKAAGFEWKGTGHNYGWVINTPIGEIELREDNIYLNENPLGLNLRLKIWYVHQLQNLYFDITGQELAIESL